MCVPWPHLCEYLGQVQVGDGPEEGEEDYLNLLQDIIRERREVNLEENVFRHSERKREGKREGRRGEVKREGEKREGRRKERGEE